MSGALRSESKRTDSRLIVPQTEFADRCVAADFEAFEEDLIVGAGASAPGELTIAAEYEQFEAPSNELPGTGEPRSARDPEVDAAAAALQANVPFMVGKRLIDITMSLLVIVLFAWLYVLIAVLIKIDDPKGPVFFTQERAGRTLPDGTPTRFTMFKFRTMCVDAEQRLTELRALNEKTGPVFKIKDDPRITRVGKWLRKLSLDELPQFFNVLIGDISVVGPRPALPKEVALYNERQTQRLLVKPGITCYWQTRRNRDAISFDEWIDLDLLYVKQAGPWSDTKLIIQTVGVVLTAQGS